MALTEAKHSEKHTSSCPWGNAAKSSQTPCSFTSLMDEEYAKQIEEDEGKLIASEEKKNRDLQLLNEGIIMPLL